MVMYEINREKTSLYRSHFRDGALILNVLAAIPVRAKFSIPQRS